MYNHHYNIIFAGYRVKLLQKVTQKQTN